MSEIVDERIDVPADGLIVFDGVCVLCSAWVAFILPRDVRSHFRFTAIQSPLGRRIAARLGIDPEQPESFVVFEGGRARFKSDGALAILARLPHWRWTAALRILPRDFRDWIYDRVARNRYRWFGRRTTCLAPDPHYAGRFLNEASDVG